MTASRVLGISDEGGKGSNLFVGMQSVPMNVERPSLPGVSFAFQFMPVFGSSRLEVALKVGEMILSRGGFECGR